MTAPGRIRVEVVYATPERQTLVEITLRPGANAGDAVDAAAAELALASPDTFQIGVWGQVCPRSRPLSDGDRVEVYRELPKDPRTARRDLAESDR